jgi:hypothetical protein
MSLAILRTELTADPLALGYSTKSDQQCYDSLIAKTRTRQRTLTTTDLLEWSGGNLRFDKIKVASNGATQNAARNLSGIMLVLLSSPGINLDMNRSASLALVDGLVSASVLVATDKTALVTAATESINRYAELGIPEYQVGDITRARAGTA